MSTPAPMPAPDTTPAPLVVGTAMSIDSGASGNPVGLRVARSVNGDGFAVWQADGGTHRDLWANRYSAAAAAWGTAINIEASNADIDDFDLTVDASGNATVVWHEGPTNQAFSNSVVAVRFDIGANAWATPMTLNTDANEPRVASDATGTVLAVYSPTRGRFFDPISGTWLPETGIGEASFGTGASHGPVPVLDGSGNVLVPYHNERFSAGILASNYFSRSLGDWGHLPPGTVEDILDPVPESFVLGFNDNVQPVTSSGGNFLLAWQANIASPQAKSEVRLAHFTSSTRTWSPARTLVPGSPEKNVQFQRLGSDGNGNALVLWTENDAMRTVLKAMRVDAAGNTCDPAQVIDSAVGGGAGRADVGVDRQGRAIAIWQQFEGGHNDDGSRSNIALNRFDGNWASAVLAEMQSGNAISPRASAARDQVLLGWIQSEGGVNRVKALLQPLTNAPGQ